MVTTLEELTREELAVLVPEYLLAGHLIDRAGMPHLIAAFGRDTMRDIAIEEWTGASPVYTRRMQRALRFEGDSVETIFKGLQLDIGAPPQFMDFRFALRDHDHGEFWLDHCGALADVEPLGTEYVVAMCHDIEDPTFDATAVATNPRAQVRPVHRPPRLPADRRPCCHWTVTIDDDHPPVPTPAAAAALARTHAAIVELDPIDPGEPGRGDYTGPLLADLRFADWSRSALLRIAQEACLQGHLLALAFRFATVTRAGEDGAAALLRRQFTGVAGVVADRLRAALQLGPGPADVARALALHPALLPHQYVGAEVAVEDTVTIAFDRRAAAWADGAWPSTLTAGDLAPLDAVVQSLDPRRRCRARADDDDRLVVETFETDVAASVAPDVALTRFSTGATFTFEDRGVPVEIRPGRR